MGPVTIGARNNMHLIVRSGANLTMGTAGQTNEATVTSCNYVTHSFVSDE